MENESRLKRLYWSAAATVIAAAIWLPSPLGELFLFPRHWPLQEKMLFVALFLVVLITLLFLFGRFGQKRSVALAVVSSAFAGLACSVIILILFALYFCYMHGNWKDISTIEKTAGLLMIYTAVSVIRGTFALAAFTALVYRYLPKLVDYVCSKYHALQAEGATRGK